jgi:hypothetical protein
VKKMGDLDAPGQVAFDSGRELLRALEVTPMTKSYKMLVVSALLEADAFPKPGLRIDELTRRVRGIAARNPRIAADLGGSARDDRALATLLETNPIEAWVGGKGTGGIPIFEYQDGVFRGRTTAADSSRASLAALAREIVEWRIAEYLARPLPEARSGSFTMSVSHTGGRPILFLPPRKQHPEVPSGWQRVLVDGREYKANFVKVAVNVVRASEDGDNELPSLLRAWFGASAGHPGTRNEVLAEPAGDGGWILRPAHGLRASALLKWTSYAREQIPPLFGEAFSEAVWNVGFVVRPPQAPKTVFLLVTLDKDEMHGDFKYADHFLSRDRFQWQSQNRTAQGDKHGQIIREHEARGVAVHLFVRPEKRGPMNSAAPFVYCGPVRFESWSGERPITVVWRLEEPVPQRLFSLLHVTGQQ